MKTIASKAAWIAGLFEGEGCIRPNTLNVSSTDLDVLERCISLSGVGRLNGPYSNKTCRAYWQWNVSRKQDRTDLITVMLPWLSERRRSRAVELMPWVTVPDDDPLIDDQTGMAWLAGLYEGEGSLVLDSRTKRTYGMSITSNDRAVLVRAQEIAGCGVVGGPYTASKSSKVHYMFRVSSWSEQKALLLGMRPWLLSRRLAKVDDALERHEAVIPYHGNPNSLANLALGREALRRKRAEVAAGK